MEDNRPYECISDDSLDFITRLYTQHYTAASTDAARSFWEEQLRSAAAEYAARCDWTKFYV